MQTVDAARDRISAARRRTSIPFATPTPERLAKAGSSAILGSSVRRVDVGVHEVDVADLKTPRFRIQGAFERLSKRGDLAPGDVMLNQDLAAAGERYARDHHRAGLDALRAIDVTGGGTDRSTGGLLGSEAKCDAFDRYRKAGDAMYRNNRMAVDAILIEGKSPVEAGAKLGSYALDKVRSALAMTFLRHGLAELAEHYAAVDANRA